MFINKNTDGSNNICGKKIAYKRKELKLSQRALSDLCELEGLSIDKNAIQRIEAGKRFVTDIELIYFSKILGITYEELLNVGDGFFPR